MITYSPVEKGHIPVLGNVYGPRWYVENPIGNSYTISGTTGITTHTGDDPQLPNNDDFHRPAYAIRDMTIRKVEKGRGKTWGWIIVASGEDELGLPFQARYAHGEKILVKVGDKVLAGDQICSIGDADGFYKGRGAHLHFDISYSGILLEDASYWPGNNRFTLFKHFVDPQEFLILQNLIASGVYKLDEVRVKLSVTSNLRIRFKASAESHSEIIGVEPPGKELAVLSPAINGFWKLAGRAGYVSGQFTEQGTPLPTTYSTRYVTADYLNVRREPREAPDTLYNPRVYLEYGAEIQVNVKEPVNGFVQMPNLRWVSLRYLSDKKPPPRSIPEQPPTQSDPRATKFGVGPHIMWGYTLQEPYPVYKAVSAPQLLFNARDHNKDALDIYRTYYSNPEQDKRLQEIINAGVEVAYNRWFSENQHVILAAKWAYYESYNEMAHNPDPYLAFEAYRAKRLWQDHGVRSCLLNSATGQTDEDTWRRGRAMVEAAIQTGSIIGVHCYSEGVISANNGPYWQQDGNWSGGSPFPGTLDPMQCHTGFRILQDKVYLRKQGQGNAILCCTEWGMDDLSLPGNGIYKPFGLQVRGWVTCWQVWERMGWSGGNTGKTHWQFYKEQMTYWSIMTRCLGTVYTDGNGGDPGWDGFNVAGYM